MTPSDKQTRIQTIKTLAEANSVGTQANDKPVVDKRKGRKIPAELNMTGDKPESNDDAKAAVAADVEKDNAKRAPKEDGKMSVADVARALGVDAKLARAKLRRMSAKGELPAGMTCVDGRWARVKKGDRLHKFLVATFKPMVEAKDDATSEPKADDDTDA